MVIFHWLGPSALGKSVLDPIASSFLGEMVPMSVVFGLLGGLVATAYSYHHSAISNQRDHLAVQLELNERYRAELERQSELLRKQNEELVRLQEANRRSTRFMVHDFKTHLGCILGFSEILLEKCGSSRDTDTTTALERIRRQALQMMGAVSDLLDLARLQNPSRLREEELRVGDLLREAIEDFSLPAHAKQIRLGPKHAGCPAVRGEFGVLRRVLTNQISNALRHNHPGTRVVVDAELRGQSSEVLFSCSDNGRGIPADILPLLFRDFGAEAGLAMSFGGLGLAFCKAAVEAHGGRIWCESSEGAGTRFYFTIPASGKEGKNDGEEKVCAHR